MRLVLFFELDQTHESVVLGGTVLQATDQEAVVNPHYSLPGELLMFGGIRRDSAALPRVDNNVETASNTLYSLSFRVPVI